MKLSRWRWWRTFIFAVFTFLALAGFETSDIKYDPCGKIGPGKADCASFKAEGAGQAQNVILIIGDGMGIGQTLAARVYINGPDKPLTWEKLPHRGLVTSCSIGGVTDSAAAATALATGNKTNNGVLSESPRPELARLPTILEQVHDKKAAGVVSTTDIWDATPAAFVAHVGQRSQDRMIARQMLLETKPEVILGGGRKAFEKEGLLPAAQTQGYQVVRTLAEMKALDLSKVKRILGLFADDELQYEVQRPANSNEPHLTDLAAAALTVLNNDPRGFFLMIEGANIDHACHATNLDWLLGEMVEFNRTVELVLKWADAHPGTLVLITADHETGGIEIVPGKYQRGDKVKVKWTTGVINLYANHSSAEVPIYGTGPNAGAIRPHLDNTEVYCIMRNAFGG